MSKRVLYLSLAAGMIAILLIAAACSSETDLTPLEGKVASLERDVSALQGKVTSVEGKAGKISAPAGEVNFFVTAYEAKGATVVQDLAPPSGAELAVIEGSDGYGFKGPGKWDSSNPDKWGVESYQWWPASMVAYQGDTVTLTVFVINGNKHEAWIESPMGAETIQERELNRGREYNLTFVASEPGNYRLICNTHEPTMVANILILPRA